MKILIIIYRDFPSEVFFFFTFLSLLTHVLLDLYLFTFYLFIHLSIYLSVSSLSSRSIYLLNQSLHVFVLILLISKLSILHLYFISQH